MGVRQIAFSSLWEGEAEKKTLFGFTLEDFEAAKNAMPGGREDAYRELMGHRPGNALAILERISRNESENEAYLALCDGDEARALCILDRELHPLACEGIRSFDWLRGAA